MVATLLSMLSASLPYRNSLCERLAHSDCMVARTSLTLSLVPVGEELSVGLRPTHRDWTYPEAMP
jgi:hypothetical protein